MVATNIDMKLYINVPGTAPIYEILRSCINELIRCNLITLEVSHLCAPLTDTKFRLLLLLILKQLYGSTRILLL